MSRPIFLYLALMTVHLRLDPLHLLAHLLHLDHGALGERVKRELYDQRQQQDGYAVVSTEGVELLQPPEEHGAERAEDSPTRELVHLLVHPGQQFPFLRSDENPGAAGNRHHERNVGVRRVDLLLFGVQFPGQDVDPRDGLFRHEYGGEVVVCDGSPLYGTLFAVRIRDEGVLFGHFRAFDLLERSRLVEPHVLLLVIAVRRFLLVQLPESGAPRHRDGTYFLAVLHGRNLDVRHIALRGQSDRFRDPVPLPIGPGHGPPAPPPWRFWNVPRGTPPC